MTKGLPFHFLLSCIGEGNGHPLQCSCLENPRDGGAWWAAVPHPEPSSLLPPHTIPLGHPSVPAPSIQYRASNLDWQLVSYMILYIFQCHSPKSSHPLPLPQSPGSMHDTGCLGLVHWDDPEGWNGEGGGRRVQDASDLYSVVVSPILDSVVLLLWQADYCGQSSRHG